MSEGFDLGLERAGFECIAQCDNDSFCNKVLAKHWPGVKRYDDVRNVTWKSLQALPSGEALNGVPSSTERPDGAALVVQPVRERVLQGAAPPNSNSGTATQMEPQPAVWNEPERLQHDAPNATESLCNLRGDDESPEGRSRPRNGKGARTAVPPMQPVAGWGREPGLSDEGIGLPPFADVIVGGFPCQDLSVAGLRRGLQGDRSGLFFEFMRIVKEMREASDGQFPRVVVIENVPGLFSSSSGRDFGILLNALAECGSVDIGWRVIDSQHWVPQRRRRVFIVAVFPPASDGRAAIGRASEILSLCESGDWHPQKGRTAREDVAATIRGRSANPGVNEPGRGGEDDSNLVLAGTLAAGAHPSGFNDQDAYANHLVAATLQGYSGRNQVDAQYVAHSLRADGFDASEDGTGRGTPLVADTYQAARYNKGNASTQETHSRTLLSALRQAVGEEAFAQWGLGILDSFQQAHLLRPSLHGGSFRREAGLGDRMGDDALSRPQAGSAWPVFNLWRAGSNGYTPQGWQPSEQLARELNAHLSQLSQPGALTEAFLHALWQASEGLGLLRKALSAVQEIWEPADDEGQSAQPRGGVRRLTPIETERLQGFPDSWTCICGANENLTACKCADGPRYKACGNAVSVPVIEYLGLRMREVLSVPVEGG